jgi:hypothetical protein
MSCSIWVVGVGIQFLCHVFSRIRVFVTTTFLKMGKIESSRRETLPDDLTAGFNLATQGHYRYLHNRRIPCMNWITRACGRLDVYGSRIAEKKCDVMYLRGVPEVKLSLTCIDWQNREMRNGAWEIAYL